MPIRRNRQWTEAELQRLAAAFHTYQSVREDLSALLPMSAPEIETARELQLQLLGLWHEVTGLAEFPPLPLRKPMLLPPEGPDVIIRKS